MTRHDIFLPCLAGAGGCAALALRLWQWSTGYDPEAQLFSHRHPASLLLLLVGTAVALVLILALRRLTPPHNFPQGFFCPAPFYMTLVAAGALLMMGAGVLGLKEGMEQLALWRLDPASQLLTYPAALILCALLSLAAGPAALAVGRGFYRGEPSRSASLLALFPPMAALVWLFATHLAHGTDPVLLSYGPYLAAALCLTLAHYYLAALLHGRLRPRRAVFFALMGLFFALFSLGDGLTPFSLALSAAFSLSALAGAWSLLRGAYGPPWPERMPSGAEEDASRDTEDER